tara:strand:- start:30 stop:458 length:429 start_codon:yes stop_codon:yes gene_type:complete
MDKTNEVVWTKSPLTGRDMVIQEFYDSTGVSKMDISSGYFTNEHPLNYKRNPNNEIKDYEKDMPESIKRLRFDDGESHWYPSIIQTDEEIVYPSGESYKTIVWHHAKFYEPKTADIDPESIKDYDSYLEASKQMNGNKLGNI